MKKSLSSRMLGATLAVSLGFSTLTSLAIAAESNTEQPSALPSVGSLTIKNKVTFEMKNIQMLPEQGSNTVAFTIAFKNEGKSDVLLFDYILKLKDKSGNEFQTRIKPQDKTISKVSANSSQMITYYAQVNSTTQLSDLVLQISQWDFSVSGFESKVGEIAVPDTYQEAIPSGDNVLLTLGGVPMNMKVSRSFNSESGKNYSPTVTLNLENAGNRSLTTPEYQFSIMTSDGYIFPFDSKKEPVALRPKESVEWRLTGKIPTTVSATGWKLIVTEKLGESTVTTPVGVFQITESTEQTENAEGGFSFNTKDGMYAAKLNGIYRAPWEDNDVLSADITLFNKEDELLPMPSLSGYLLLDNKVKVDVSVVQSSQSAGISPSGAVKVHAAGVIPYDHVFTSVKLVLQEKESTTGKTDTPAKVIDLLEFPAQTKLQPLAYYGVNDYYSVSEPGRSLKYQVVGINRYEGMAGDIAAIQLEIENLSKRPVNLSNIIASIGLGDGSATFPGKIAAVKNKVSPEGKAMLEIWSSLPKGFSTSSLHIIIGDAISGGKLAEGDAKADAYISPVAFWAPAETAPNKNLTSKINIYPYTFQIRNLDTASESDSFSMQFDYEIAKSKLVETNLEGHNLVMSIVDSNGYKLFENAYKMSEFETGTSGGSSGENALRIGKNKFKANITKPDAGSKLAARTRTAKLYIYDEFQGQRRLLAEQAITLYSKIGTDE
ncbi:hypothetical protein E0485_18070 [Paenibacillus albiflavus]|uniref:DUF916 domain-containing protein n=1 Tax=Paenibacillus albiflavus TaxID=2545760 RepID=A0A4R4E6H6_9BACL|nr:hypothetical protein [Paenibacillus albiflavus]TCZ75296.1 hypothetical protein E0485_18070 [Paenibacillus albiflavus]